MNLEHLEARVHELERKLSNLEDERIEHIAEIGELRGRLERIEGRASDEG